MIVAVDFDGTLVEHRYPDIGPDVPLAFDYLLMLQNEGVHLILWTMRADRDLTEAAKHCTSRGVVLWGLNSNPEQDWSTSPKAFAHFYVDDAAICVPLVMPRGGRRPYVDWSVVGPLLLAEAAKRKRRLRDGAQRRVD